MITSLRGACTASDEAIHSKILNLQDCRVGLTRCNDAAGEGEYTNRKLRGIEG
ncbi:MAG: hypothetical protein LBK53_03940 [Heliobacteriaceae bacterium]|nr:hypothetical protein [Heliobacteriaceae bacterium]